MPTVTAATDFADVPARSRLERWRDRLATNGLAWIGLTLLLALLFLLFIWPVGMLLVGIFRNAAPGQPGAWTTDAIVRVFTSAATYNAVQGSLIYAVASTAFGTLLGAFFAFLSARTTVPLIRYLTPVMVLVFAAPHIMYGLSWGLLTDSATGFLNYPARLLWGPDSAPLNVYSWPGLILVHVLKLASFCYLLLLPSFYNLNRALEEASDMAGASQFATFFRIDLPLLTPALFGVAILGGVLSLGAFDLPQILGGLAGISVISTQIFRALNFSAPPDYAAASALGLFMMVAMVLLLSLQWRLFGAGRFVTISGKGHSERRWNLGRWTYPCAAAIGIYAFLALLLPGVQLVTASFQQAVGINTFTLQSYRAVFADPMAASAFRVTAFIAIFGGFIAVALAAVVAHIGRHSPRWLEIMLDSIGLLPIIMPGMVLCVGLLWAYISVPLLRQLYGTFWLALIALIVYLTPIASRVARGGIVQISVDLEEAARVGGASHARVFFDIILRLLSRSLLAGWLVAAIVASGTLDLPLMLLPPNLPSVSVLAYSYMDTGLPSQASALLVLLMAAIFFVYLATTAAASLAARLRNSRPDRRPAAQQDGS